MMAGKAAALAAFSISPVLKSAIACSFLAALAGQTSYTENQPFRDLAHADF
jgi:hypothetical protein